MYGIRDGYTPRLKPDYFQDIQTDFPKLWQPDVLPIAVHIARLNGCKTLIDIGCGRGEKLVPYANEFDIIGMDYGDNLDYCRSQHDFGRWLDVDLERDVLDIPGDVLKKSVLVCSDVVEHLVNPEKLALNLKMLLICAPYLVLSTPDRLRTYGQSQDGPPGNPHHVREWTLAELAAWLESYGFTVEWKGWTRSNDMDQQKNTTLLVLSAHRRNERLGNIEGLFEVDFTA